jgi:23S rRNA pseudoU1915 N3-methylase RlmH
MVSAGANYHWLIPALRGLLDQSIAIFTDGHGKRFSPAELAQEIENWTELGQLIVAVEGVVALALLGSEVDSLEKPK